jgi:hypothetical protein
MHTHTSTYLLTCTLISHSYQMQPLFYIIEKKVFYFLLTTFYFSFQVDQTVNIMKLYEISSSSLNIVWV